MGKGVKGMGTAMRRLMFFSCLAFLMNFSFAQGKLSERLALPKELQGELPWFAMVEKDGESSYNGILSKDRLKTIAAQKNSKRVVLAFYATWCIPCREGLTRLSEKAAELEKNNVLVVLANVGEDDYGKINKWINKYAKDGWLLCFDKFNNISENFGLSKAGEEMPLPKTLLLDQNLRPIMLIGHEGDDYPQILKD
jgi:peroxiredoxin